MKIFNKEQVTRLKKKYEILYRAYNEIIKYNPSEKDYIYYTQQVEILNRDIARCNKVINEEIEK